MKRFIIISALLVVIVGVMLYFMPQSFDKVVARYAPSNATVTLYCRETSLNCIDMGMGKKVVCTFSDYSQTLAHCSQLDGFSVSFDGSFADVQNLLNKLDVTVIDTQQLDGVTVICGVTRRIRNGVFVGGKYVNVQIAYNRGAVTIGSPLILGDY